MTVKMVVPTFGSFDAGMQALCTAFVSDIADLDSTAAKKPGQSKLCHTSHAYRSWLRAENPMKPLPSLDVLKTFLVVAQKLNFTRAAQTLNVTQGAVSRQIAGLETHLGYALFVRQARRLALTHHGVLLVAPLQQAFAQIGDALAKGSAQSGTLRVKCPTCAMHWILPRVIRLQNERPESAVEVTASVSHGVDFNAEPFDAAIVFGKPALKGMSAHHLFDELLTPVCAPETWKPRTPGVPTPGDLADQTLLHPTRDRRDWLRWLNAYGSPACHRRRRSVSIRSISRCPSPSRPRRDDRRCLADRRRSKRETRDRVVR
ncbi:Glycine cleavage system transcriptional activator [Candidatus Burkholderia humilis]|nr:Glycine cleavage system transcriptional activator [Candidatus Burkholderia humilis]